jgi:hypothetical protein
VASVTFTSIAREMLNSLAEVLIPRIQKLFPIVGNNSHVGWARFMCPRCLVPDESTIDTKSMKQYRSVVEGSA